MKNFISELFQSFFGLSSDLPNYPMEDKNKKEEMIEKLIEKRKQENDAFIKLLHAIESKGHENKEKHPPLKPAKNSKKKNDE